MEIEYLKKMKENPSIDKDYPMRGLSLDGITELELKLNNGLPFSKAFREFLFLGGDFNDLGIGPGYDIDFNLKNGEDYIQQMEVYKGLMQKQGLSIDRPYIIFNPGDDSSFDFIYLDEGDNPRPQYFYISDSLMANESRIGDFPEKTFSELIDRLVDFAIRGLQPF